MLVLALDCALSACSVALVQDDQCLDFDHRPMDRGQAEHLVPMIEGLFTRSGLAPNELGLIVATVGPGTFTGIRIGLSTARGLALALGCPVAGISTMQALAAGLAEESPHALDPLLVVLDSRRDELWMQMFDPQGRPMDEVTALPPHEVGRLVTGPVRLAGDGVELVAPFLPQARLTASQTPDARPLARFGLTCWRQGLALAAQPLYLRDADVTQ